jgi:hypothetical protein
VIAVSAAVASALVVTQSPNLSPIVGGVGFALTLGLAIGASTLSTRAKPPRVIFHLLLVASLVNVVLLMIG